MNTTQSFELEWVTSIDFFLDDYDAFVDRYMEKYLHPYMFETDEEFDERCKIAWKKALASNPDEETLNTCICDWIEKVIETEKDREYKEHLRKDVEEIRHLETGACTLSNSSQS
jgi:hypothetical protein